jgi:pyruvate dehydrogenase E2 component (dihydrolipoamide acetyltransferase)
MADVIMPKMSDAMTEGRVLSWRKRAGERVEQGEVVAEIETDKVNVEIEAEASGTLSDILIGEGQTAPVGAVIAHINGGGEGAHPGRTGEPPAPASAEARPGDAAKARPAEPGRPAAAASRPGGTRAQAEPQAGAPPTPPRAGRLPDAERIKASPLARRLAAEHGVDLAGVAGTGPGGRIVERDIEAHLTAAPGAHPPQPKAAPAGVEYEDVDLSRMREAIARSTVHSKQVAPHFYVTCEVDMGRARDLRAQLKDAYGEEAGRVSVNDLILKAAALALRAHPDLNAQFVEPHTLRRFHRVHLGIMVAVPDGLILPVLRDADRLPILPLAREAHRLIEGARERRLKQDEQTGATFSVSNLGMYDVTNFVAIISAPQAGILAVGRIQDRPVAREGQVVVRPTMELTISADHRVTDGVGAAAFLVEVKRLLENPVLLLAQ